MKPRNNRWSKNICDVNRVVVVNTNAIIIVVISFLHTYACTYKSVVCVFSTLIRNDRDLSQRRCNSNRILFFVCAWLIITRGCQCFTIIETPSTRRVVGLSRFIFGKYCKIHSKYNLKPFIHQQPRFEHQNQEELAIAPRQHISKSHHCLCYFTAG